MTIGYGKLLPIIFNLDGDLNVTEFVYDDVVWFLRVVVVFDELECYDRKSVHVNRLHILVKQIQLLWILPVQIRELLKILEQHLQLLRILLVHLRHLLETLEQLLFCLRRFLRDRAARLLVADFLVLEVVFFWLQL